MDLNINERTYSNNTGNKTLRGFIYCHAKLRKRYCIIVISRLTHHKVAKSFASCENGQSILQFRLQTRVYSRHYSRPYRKAHKRKEAPSFHCWSNKRRGIISWIYDFRNTSANAEFPRRWKVSLDLSPSPLSFPFLSNARSYPAQNPYPAITKLSRDSELERADQVT